MTLRLPALTLTLALALSAVPALAAEVVDTGANGPQIAATLGEVVASEQVCGLTYDQGAIADYVKTAVPENNVSFAVLFNDAVKNAKHGLADMSESQKTAHCTHIQQLATFLRFTS